jgi:hypothetical protein
MAPKIIVIDDCRGPADKPSPHVKHDNGAAWVVFALAALLLVLGALFFAVSFVLWQGKHQPPQPGALQQATDESQRSHVVIPDDE